MLPPLTVASLPMNTHSRPCTTPTPVTRPALGASFLYRPQAARGESSKKSVPGSTMRWILSRGSNFPLERCASTLLVPPPPRAHDIHFSKSSTNLVLCAALFAKVSSFLTLERMIGADGWLGPAEPHVLARRRCCGGPASPGITVRAAGRSRATGCSSVSPSSSASCSPLASMTTRAWPSATCCSLLTSTSLTSPLTPAVTSLSIFMALMITTAVPPRTLSPAFTLTSETCPWKGASTLMICPATAPVAAATGFPVTTSGLSLRKEV
mmetsp:Transcript_43582/g.100815  ORF Transcript_43582/g.100815 Transcript_43582/m.100815 type:complete len:267 (+) Transcript_43582:1289-2089(+)